MDAGNFSNLNFGNIGPSRFQKAPGPNVNQENAREIEDKGPRESVDLGSLPFLEVNRETLPSDVPVNPIIAGSVAPSKTDSFNLSGPLGLDALNGIESAKFSTEKAGLTAVNGPRSTAIFSVGGFTLASANPFNPVTLTRMPTTSVTTNGIESTQFVTSSGRVIGSDSGLTVKMPTTSITTFGLEDSQWLTTSGRTISL
jgi:hypothetical protein